MNGSKFIPYSGQRTHAAKIVSRRLGLRNFANVAYKEDGDGLAVEELKKINTNFEKSLQVAEEAKTVAKETGAKQAELLAQLKELNDENSSQKAWRTEAEAKAAENQKALNEMIVDIKSIKEGGVKLMKEDGLDFGSSLAKSIKDNAGSVAKVTKGKGFSFDLAPGTGLYQKAAANMTTSGNLTGSPNITYMPQPVLFPRQLVNFRDLVPSFQSETGLIALFREDGSGTTPESGAFGTQLTQGSLKEQVGYTFTNVQFTANYMSGFVRISKQMLQDLLFLQTYLPSMLLRDYYKYENAQFYAAQVAAALGSTTTSGGNDAEKFIDYITNLEGSNFAPNGIVTTPAIWGKIMKTTVPSIGTSYSVPGGFYINPATGQVEIAGIPIIKATWIASGGALIADWTQSQIATVDGLKVEFFEQDSDNVQRNLITVRIEARVVLVTAQPYAFIAASGL